MASIFIGVKSTDSMEHISAARRNVNFLLPIRKGYDKKRIQGKIFKGSNEAGSPLLRICWWHDEDKRVSKKGVYLYRSQRSDESHSYRFQKLLTSVLAVLTLLEIPIKHID